MSLPVYFAFLLACAVVMIGPNPALTLIVASRLRHGRRAGMLNAAGIQLGLAFAAGMVLLDLASLMYERFGVTSWARSYLGRARTQNRIPLLQIGRRQTRRIPLANRLRVMTDQESGN